jgi:hypothetical protein
VQRINEAILHLDGATQQNAALVEEGSAASRTLQDQADTLSSRASFFTVVHPSTHDSSAQRTEPAAPSNAAPSSAAPTGNRNREPAALAAAVRKNVVRRTG